jgi:hypothetical protein
MCDLSESFAFFVRKGEETAASILGCIPSLFDPSFVPDCDPILSQDEAEILELWEAYHLAGCYPDNCVHRAAIFLELLWQRDPVTYLVDLFFEAPSALSAAELAEWNPPPSPMPEVCYLSDDGFTDALYELSTEDFWSEDDSSADDLWD